MSSLATLIVDDSEDDAALIVRELRRGGYDVAYERVDNAGAMHTALAAKTWDVVIADYAMPRFSGPAALRLVKDSGLDLPFILVSGIIGEESGIEAMRSGAHDFLTKHNLSRLVPAVERELKEAAARREQRNAEETVREQAALIELAHDAIIVLDLEQRIVLWNRGAEQTYGWTKDEALGKHAPTLLQTRFPTPFDAIGSTLLRDGQWEGELTHIRRDGQKIEVTTRWAVQRDRNGKPVGTLEINRDITLRKRAEEELAKYLGHLEEQVRARTSELTLANQKLEKEIADRTLAEKALQKTADELARSNQELEQFAYAASHDLQEPLRAVSGFVQLLRDRYRNKLDDRADEYIGFAVDGARRMSQLIADLLEYSRAGRQDRELGETDAAENLRRALTNLRISIDESRAVITCDLLPKVRGDPIQLTLLFQNLIGNAIKFARTGIPPEVHVGVRPGQNDWTFWVRDNGIGIAAEHHEQIFTIFRRLHSSTEYPGTGVGLAICRKIVERHGGRIWVESDTGQGSTFFFTIPQLR